MKNILEYEDVLKSLVQKFNKGVWDEDMMQDAWVKAIECYNTCVEKNITDDNIVKAKIITWVKNYFINEKKKKQLEIEPLIDENDILSQVDTTLLLVELRNSLSEQENMILNNLLNGKTVKEISEITKLPTIQIYRKIKNIKKKILS